VRRTWLLPPLILALASPSTASAQGDPAAAAELFRQGREALGQKDYATACPKFAESQRLDPKVGTLINLAQCADATGKLASALRHWAEAQTLAHSLGDGRESYVVQQHDALLPRVPHLSVHLAAGTPDDARVTIDGTEIAHSDLGASLPVDTGPHVLVVSAAGHADARTEIVANEGVAADVSLNAGPIVPPMDAEPPSATSHAAGAISRTSDPSWRNRDARLAPRVWIGLAVQFDFAILNGASEVCGGGGDYSCVDSNDDTVTVTSSDLGTNRIYGGGQSPGTCATSSPSITPRRRTSSSACASATSASPTRGTPRTPSPRSTSRCAGPTCSATTRSRGA
jgi:hypothetical protein